MVVSGKLVDFCEWKSYSFFFFDELSVYTSFRLELDVMCSHIGFPLLVGFMYRKPERRLKDKMDRIVGDA